MESCIGVNKAYRDEKEPVVRLEETVAYTID
jgi:hypothetical protein